MTVGSTMSKVCSILLVVLVFFFLAVFDSFQHLDDSIVINHKIHSLVSFGKHNASTVMAPIIIEKSKSQLIPMPQTDLTTKWPHEVRAYNAQDEIFLDWSIASFQFSYIHYKALESAFMSYPKASFSLL